MARRSLGRLSQVIDGILDVAVASLAWWTVLYAIILCGLPLVGAFVAWLVGTVVLAGLRSQRRWFAAPLPTRTGATVGATLVSVALALVSSVISRPDGDDAVFVIRSTWVADRGVLPTGDMIFSDGSWPATFGAAINLSSIETLFGAVARYTGASTGDVVYRYFVPFATFAAVWAVWLLLRVWRARRPTLSLVVAMVFVLAGGYAHTTFGNMHLARIWQGKAVLVAVLVPYLYAVLFTAVRSWHRSTGPHRVGTPLLLLCAGVAAVGATSTSVFLVPLIAAAAALPLLWRRRVIDAMILVVASAVGPVLAGILTVLQPGGSGNELGLATEWVWSRVLVSMWVGLAALVACLAVLAGTRWPAFRAIEPDAQTSVATVVVVAFLCTIWPMYPVLTTLMAGDAIAHRLAWVLPLPAVIGLVASLPARRWAMPVVPLVGLVVGAILMAGQPLWAASNSAHFGHLGTWKVRDQADVAAARWIVDQQPEGRYLAANWVTFLVGTMTSELRPVGTRLDYVQSLKHLPGSQVTERLLLQRIADGAEARTDDNLPAGREALDALDVDVACVAWDDTFTEELMSSSGFVEGLETGPWTCWSRDSD